MPREQQNIVTVSRLPMYRLRPISIGSPEELFEQFNMGHVLYSWDQALFYRRKRTTTATIDDVNKDACPGYILYKYNGDCAEGLPIDDQNWSPNGESWWRLAQHNWYLVTSGLGVEQRAGAVCILSRYRPLKYLSTKDRL